MREVHPLRHTFPLLWREAGQRWGKCRWIVARHSCQLVGKFYFRHRRWALWRPAYHMRITVFDDYWFWCVDLPCFLQSNYFNSTLQPPPPRELLQMVNKLADDIKFLNDGDTRVVPPGCHYVVLLRTAARFPCFFHEPRKDLVVFVSVGATEVNPQSPLHWDLG